MFSIYRRFDTEPLAGKGNGQTEKSAEAPASFGMGEARGKTGAHPERGSNIPRTYGQGQHMMSKGQSFAGAPLKGQRQGQKNSQNQLPGYSQKALPPANGHRESADKKRERTSGDGHKKQGFLQGILPHGLYDPKSKKLFGVLAAEDLLLVALIFLLLEKDGEDNTLMVLALFYVLLSDYIDLPELGF